MIDTSDEVVVGKVFCISINDTEHFLNGCQQMQGDAYVPFTREYLEAHGGECLFLCPLSGGGQNIVVVEVRGYAYTVVVSKALRTYHMQMHHGQRS